MFCECRRAHRLHVMCVCARVQGGLQSPGDGLPRSGGQHDGQLRPLPPSGGALRTDPLDQGPHPSPDSGRSGSVSRFSLPYSRHLVDRQGQRKIFRLNICPVRYTYTVHSSVVHRIRNSYIRVRIRNWTPQCCGSVRIRIIFPDPDQYQSEKLDPDHS